MNVKLGLIGVLGIVGCASTGGPGSGERDFSGAIRRDVPSVIVGEARVVDAKVNPVVQVRASTEGDGVMLRFGRPGHAEAVARLDPESLHLVSVEENGEREAASRPSPDAARVQLDGGRFIVCWKRGDAESGYRALAQEFKGDGTPVGAPAVISPPDVDVMGVPQVVTTDGRHVVATFAVSSGGAFQLLAVPIAGAGMDVSGESLALRR